MPPFRSRRVIFTGATMPALCEVRGKTESPCPRRAAIKIRGVAFCEACAREQEAYFAIGELAAQDEGQGLRGEQLAEALKRMRRERAGGGESAPAEPHRGISNAFETTPLTLSNK